MERGWRTAPLGSIATDTFLVTSIVQALVDDAPLESCIVVVVHRHILLATPTKAAVVDNDVAGILDANGSALDEAVADSDRCR